MTRGHCQRYFGAVIAVAIGIGGTLVGAAPVAASTATSGAVVCGPATSSHYQAPTVGGSASYAAGSAGSVTVLHKRVLTLEVTAVYPNSGWKDTVITAISQKVHVGFQGTVDPNEQERFWARLDSTGTRITIIVQSCT
jgi:type IV secretory pathway VirJ component